MIARIASLVFAAVLVPSLACAQVAPPPAGITVIGRGLVRVPADELRFTASLFPVNGRATTDLDAAADAVAKALRDGGVPDAASGFAGNYNVNGPRVISGTLRKPTRDAVDALLKRGSAAAAPFPSVNLQGFALNLMVDECRAPEARAQDAAIADARVRADSAAHAAGVHIGRVLNVNESTAFAPFGTGNCATKPDTAATAQQRFDGDGTGDVFVGVNATVTFAIVP